jgi:hypothetical protein
MSDTSIGQPPIPPSVDQHATESDGKTLNDRGTNRTEHEPDPTLESANGEATSRATDGKSAERSPYTAGNY